MMMTSSSLADTKSVHIGSIKLSRHCQRLPALLSSFEHLSCVVRLLAEKQDVEKIRT